jgi:hypothetical protein
MSNMRQSICCHDPRIGWPGAVSVEHSESHAKPWRIPFTDAGLYPQGVREKAVDPSGVRIGLLSDSRTIAIHISPRETDCILDLTLSGRIETTLCVPAGETVAEFHVPVQGMNAVEIWFPTKESVQLRKIEIDSNAVLEEWRDTRPRWITYGSSITQCGAAASPAQTWPAIVAREKKLNLMSLGFGGQCHADPEVFRLIRDMPADFISMCLGINIYGGKSLNGRSFGPAVIGGIRTVREGHPAIPIVICSPIFSRCRETTPNAVEMTLVTMREQIKETVETLRNRGDKNLFYVDGLRLFGQDLAEFLPDDLHPNAEGYRRLGKNFIDAVFGENGLEITL